jgi:hypothetical protein
MFCLSFCRTRNCCNIDFLLLFSFSSTSSATNLAFQFDSEGNGSKKSKIAILITVPTLALIFLTAGSCFLCRRKNTRGKIGSKQKMIGQWKRFGFIATWMERMVSIYSQIMFFLWPLIAATSPRQDKNGETISLVSLQHSFNSIKTATNNFSDSNKIGQGGFGTVYKVCSLNHRL